MRTLAALIVASLTICGSARAASTTWAEDDGSTLTVMPTTQTLQIVSTTGERETLNQKACAEDGFTWETRQSTLGEYLPKHGGWPSETEVDISPAASALLKTLDLTASRKVLAVTCFEDAFMVFDLGKDAVLIEAVEGSVMIHAGTRR
jgi:hypothetical protein